MNSTKIVKIWVETFNNGDANAIAEFYSDIVKHVELN